MSLSSKFMRGSPILLGDSSVPGVPLPKELNDLLPTIFKAVRDFGCDFFPTVVQMLTYNEISEVAAYGGFPVRYPHWQWGMEYEELQRGYEFGMHRIYEMVVNTNPCYIYCLDSNTLVDNVTVVAHALGHNDFFKNNIFFHPTSQNMMNDLANHGTRIRKYMSRWGKERVTEFIDYVLRIQTLIDPTKAWDIKKIKDPIVKDSRVYEHPGRLKVSGDREYMENYINPKGWIQKQQEDIHRKEVARELGIFEEPTKNIMGFLRDHAPLKPWQADILAMLYDEAMYFAPQRMTKMLNEGWASYIDFNMMAKQGLVGLGQKSHDCGIFEYAKHKMGVLGGKYSMNPYKLGFCLFQEIEERWDKGRFGNEYENCENIVAKENWDTKAGLGHEKVFEVRRNYNDLTALIEYFTPEFCEKNEFFEWAKYPNGEYRIENRDFKSIRKKILQRHSNGGLPEIKLADPNHRGRGYMLLEHTWDGRTLHDSYVKATMQGLYVLWGADIYLATCNKNNEEVIYYCMGTQDEDVGIMTREEYEKSPA